MKTILVASDFEEVSNNATVYALEAARKIGAKVVLFHLYRMSIHAANARLSPSSMQETIDREKAAMDKRILAYKATYGVEIVGDWTMGEFHTELQRSVDTHGVDLVVMGMARKSIEQDLLGNTTTAAINRIKFPILAVPQGVEFQGIKRILFACDMTRGVHGLVLERVRKLALGFGAEVQVFHVSDQLKAIEQQQLPEKMIKSFGDGLDGIQYTYKNVSSNAVVQAIENELAAMNADLLIMVPYRYGFWGSLVHRSKTRAMASGSSVPLLSLPI